MLEQNDSREHSLHQLQSEHWSDAVGGGNAGWSGVHRRRQAQSGDVDSGSTEIPARDEAETSQCEHYSVERIS